MTSLLSIAFVAVVVVAVVVVVNDDNVDDDEDDKACCFVLLFSERLSFVGLVFCCAAIQTWLVGRRTLSVQLCYRGPCLNLVR